MFNICILIKLSITFPPTNYQEKWVFKRQSVIKELCWTLFFQNAFFTRVKNPAAFFTEFRRFFHTFVRFAFTKLNHVPLKHPKMMAKCSKNEVLASQDRTLSVNLSIKKAMVSAILSVRKCI